MGVRLVRYNRPISGNTDSNTSKDYDHSELINRDLLNQHPIYAITGLQEALNFLEDAIYDVSLLIKEKEKGLSDKIASNLKLIQALTKDMDALEKRIKANEDAIKKILSTKYLDTYSVDLTYNSNTPSLKADVRVWEPDAGKNNTNALQVLAKGLYVPKFVSKDSATIIWTEEVKGESLSEIFTNGQRFSHTADNWSDHCNTTEENAWYWDDTLQSFVQPRNTGYFNGFVTKEVYDNYTHLCTIRSTDGDDDLNGVVIGYVTDSGGLSHTLTVVCDRGGLGGNTLAVWYNYQHPNNQRLMYKTLGSSGGWSAVPTGITIEIKKNKNVVSICSSKFNSAILDESLRMDIDLNDYSWGSLFSGPVKYGYCNFSQAYSYYNVDNFTSTYVANSIETVASVKLSQEALNGLLVKDDGLYCEKFIFNISPDADNILVKRNNGYYVPNKAKLSGLDNNAIIAKSDGLWAEAFVMSPDTNNALSKRANGYYVPAFVISPNANNALVHLSNGYFVQKFLLNSQADNAIENINNTYYVRRCLNYKLVTQNNHGFVVGDFIYYHHANGYQKALALDSYDSNIIGMVTKVINANSFEYQWDGFFSTTVFNNAAGYVQGMPLYISDVHAGKVTQSQPDISKTVGYPVENAGIIICIERGIQYNQEASIGDFKTSTNTYNVRSDGFIRVVEGVEFKQSLIKPLIDTISDDFKNSYMTFDDAKGVMTFKNTQELYNAHSVVVGMNLFIKAF